MSNKTDTTKSDFIELYDGVFSDEFCDNLIAMTDALDSSGSLEKRQTNSVSISDKSCFLNPFGLEHISDNSLQTFHELFWSNCYNPYKEKFGILETIQSHSVHTTKVQKTRPGEGYHTFHCENASRATGVRVLAYVVYLNDDFEAGETEFLYQQKRLKPKKGTVCIFPASFTHTHRGNPPMGGNKYILTGWLEF